MTKVIFNEQHGFKGFSGKSILRAFPKGIIGKIMADGFSLGEAIDIAVESGLCAHEDTVENLVVTVGKRRVGDLLIGVSTLGLTHHEIGTGTTTPALADTALTTARERKVITEKVRSGNTITLSTFYLASECTYNLKEAGVFCSTSLTEGAGTMFCHYLQNYDNSGGLYDLTFEYSLEVE